MVVWRVVWIIWVETYDHVSLHSCQRLGLGNALYPTVGALDVEHVHAFAAKHLVAPKTALVGFGVDHADLMQAASYFLGGFTAASTPATVASKYHGGEHMDEAAAVDGVHYALAGPTTGYTGDDHFTAAVLRELFGASNVSSVAFGTNHRLLGGINAAPGVTVEAFSESYSDAGLFGFYVQGSNDVSSASVSAAIKSTVAQLKEVAAGNFGAAGTDVAVKRAVQAAKLTMLDDSVDRLTKLREVHARVASGNKALASSASVAAALDGVTAQKLSKVGLERVGIAC